MQDAGRRKTPVMFTRRLNSKYPFPTVLSNATIPPVPMTVATIERLSRNDIQQQTFLNGEVHDWYRLVLGYSDRLVGGLLDEFEIKVGDSVLDPFCGAGTTLVEAMKRGVLATGIDANPSSFFAATVKTNWDLRGETLLECLDRVAAGYRGLVKDEAYEADFFCEYLTRGGFLKRRWLSVKPLRKVIAIRRAIQQIQTRASYKGALQLALIAETIRGSANIKFGPELYCGRSRRDASVFAGFRARVEKMAADLALVKLVARGTANVILGDARQCARLIPRGKRFSAIISSPPYPAEHDYTRNARLELALLGAVTDRESLRKIKMTMIRSHTKGIYKGDCDAALVKGHSKIERIARILEQKAEGKTHGFARLYSTVLREYFGGMKSHFRSVRSLVKPRALCAYVVGDQSSYLQVHIPTAEILSSLASEVGFDTIEIRHWRSRWSTATSRLVPENILILRPRA